MWVIYSHFEDGYWSNRYGWTGLNEATLFSGDESLEIEWLPSDDAVWKLISSPVQDAPVGA